MEVGSTGSERAVVVLLVEDSRTDAELVESLLRHSSAARFDVTVAGSLVTALEWLARHTPDVVLLDLTLSDSAGLATYRSVRNRDPEVPVVVLTGLQDSGLGQSAMQLGAQDFLAKGTASVARLAETLLFAIERARHTAHVLRDPLTGLATPALLGERIAEALLRSEREKRYVGVLAIGLDGFAGIDIRFGPNSGRGVALRRRRTALRRLPAAGGPRPGGRGRIRRRARGAGPPVQRRAGRPAGARRPGAGDQGRGREPAGGAQRRDRPGPGRRPTGRGWSAGPGRRWPTSAAPERRASASPPERPFRSQGRADAPSGPDNGLSTACGGPS